MTPSCPHCEPESETVRKRPDVVRRGTFYRTSDSRAVQRFQCRKCRRFFSFATLDPCYRQNKRHKNKLLEELFSSGVSQRRAARLLRLNRITVVRKFLFLAKEAALKFAQSNLEKPKAQVVEFDDLITIEHSKCKPLSVILAVESGTRRILGFEVAQMPANGPLAAISRKKYGPREDERPAARSALFETIKPLIAANALIKSDKNPHYPPDVKKHFPDAKHQTFKGRRGCVAGQGELKKIEFDPIFSINHTFAKLRADINRLFRRTWCTTKKRERLAAHLMIYAVYHNLHL